MAQRPETSTAPRWLGAVAILVALSGCRSGAGEPTPEDAVRSLFAAIDRRDCPGLRDAVAGVLAERIAGAGCDETFDEFERHGFALMAIERTEVDGRDPDARLVRARVRKNGEQQAAIVRVERVGGRWKVTLL